MMTQASLPCNLNSFGNIDPAYGQGKLCQYIPVAYPSAETTGNWQGVDDCGGNTCNKPSYSITLGTTETNTKASSNSWSNTFTLSISGQGGVKFAGGSSTQISVSDAQTFAGSTTYTNALDQTATSTIEVTCGSSASEGVHVYQFSLNTSAQCQHNVLCSTTTYTGDYYCATANGMPANYQGPQCLPTMCADAYCQTCNYSPNALVYYDPKSGAVYLLLDGSLRSIPDSTTGTNLLGPSYPYTEYNQIKSTSNPSIPYGTPIMKGAQLVTDVPNQPAAAFFLTDMADNNLVLRHVFSLNQLAAYGFSGSVLGWSQTTWADRYPNWKIGAALSPN
ncbi:MAG: hypothetical protein IH605_00565 [Burkholderiales bacterium]|nr:hypothetical protein [Burkholderiales bacterium]